MGLLATVVIGSALIGGGIAEAVSATSSNPKAPSPPALPNQTTATATAQDQVNQQRKLALLTGGLTDYTGGQAVLGSGDINKTTLLGN